MVDSLKNNTPEDLELLEIQREEECQDIINDLFGGDDSGLYGFFDHRNETNDEFMGNLVSFEHQLNMNNIFQLAKESGVFHSREIVLQLIRIFNEIGSTVDRTDVDVFDRGKIAKDEFMGLVQIAFSKMVKKFNDAEFNAHRYFIEETQNYAVHGVPKRTVPPGSAWTLSKRGANDSPASSKEEQFESSRPGGKIITAKFGVQREQLELYEMVKLDKELGLDKFSEENFLRLSVPEVLRVSSSLIYKYAPEVIRGTPSRRMDHLVDSITKKVVAKLEQIAVEKKDVLVAHILISYYKEGRGKILRDLELAIRQQAVQYFEYIKRLPPTQPPTRTKTLIPSYGAVPAPAPLLPPKEKTYATPVPTEEHPERISGRTLRPKDLDQDPELIGQETRQALAAPKPLDPASFGELDAANDLTASGIDDTEITQEMTLPKVDKPAGAFPPLERIPLPAWSRRGSQPVITPAAQTSDSHMRDALPTIPDAPTLPQIDVPVQKAAVTLPSPENTSPVKSTTIHAPYQVPSTAPTPAPTASPKMDLQAEKPAAPAPKKTSGFFTRAKKWVAGGVLAAAAAFGIYNAQKTEAPSDIPSVTASASSNGDSKKEISSTVSATPSSTQNFTPAVPPYQIDPQPTASSLVAPSAAPFQAPVAPKIAQAVPEAAPKVAAVLQSESFSLGQSEVPAPFSGKASQFEGGVDATPVSPDIKLPQWYTNQQKSAEALMSIYHSNPERIDKDTLTYIKSHEVVLADMASRKSVTDFRSFERKYGSNVIFAANGVENFIIGFERAANLAGGVSKLVSGDEHIKITIGAHTFKESERFANAVLFEAKADSSKLPASKSGTDSPKDAPQNGGVQQKDAPQQPDAGGIHGFNRIYNSGPLNGPAIQDTDQVYGLNQSVDTKSIDDEWDNILQEQKASTELDSIEDEWDRIIHDQKVSVASVMTSQKSDPEIEVGYSDISLPELVELDRQTALRERGEVVIPPSSTGETGSAFQAFENGFIKECSTLEKQQRVRQYVSKMRFSALESYDALNDGKVYAKLNASDLENLNNIIA